MTKDPPSNTGEQGLERMHALYANIFYVRQAENIPVFKALLYFLKCVCEYAEKCYTIKCIIIFFYKTHKIW